MSLPGGVQTAKSSQPLQRVCSPPNNAGSTADLSHAGVLGQVLDNAEPLPRDPLAPFRMSVIDRYRDMGTIAMGKSECGVVRKGDQLYVMPNK